MSAKGQKPTQSSDAHRKQTPALDDLGSCCDLVPRIAQ